ncbi:MAG TPA: hypothetical protein VEQ37_05500 [Actinomycetota bacterium]|nr:hypothetical protein [Actinomycetota bacterium]
MRRMLSPQTSFDCHLVRSGVVGDLHHGNQIEHFLVHAILWPGTSEPHGLPKDLEQPQAEPGLSAQLPIGLRGEAAVPIPAREVQEPEREIAVSDGGAHPLERQSTTLEAPNQPHPPEATLRERRAGLGSSENAEFNQTIHVADVDTRSLGQCFTRETVHDSSLAPLGA